MPRRIRIGLRGQHAHVAVDPRMLQPARVGRRSDHEQRHRERRDDHDDRDDGGARGIEQTGDGRDPEGCHHEREHGAEHGTPLAVGELPLYGLPPGREPRQWEDGVMSASYSALSSYSRVEIMHQLQQRSRRTIAELCESTGLHANTVREHLQRLMDGGHVVIEREARSSRGRPRMLYSAADGTPTASSPIARARVQDAAARGDLLRRVLPGESGHLEPDALHQIDAVVDDLLDGGFEPLVDEDALTIDLTPCPHAADPVGRRSRLCSVHLGILQSVLTEARGPLRITGMAPSCDPAQCVVLLAR